ncbi:hypothetical protein DFH94DRAFT_402866 [Russula ochroleuca]|uniref:F-box domain-containing protein n=1 Tax=Russula ochroleuca TaxID=152965 RepID=A0A9P5MY13_9AGAM|nr:hypothetical protein DFH94DRAFT_402866 [Russula ochroleuca]
MTLMDGYSGVSPMTSCHSCDQSHQTRKGRTTQCHCQVTPIYMLPDEVLLEIFEFYVDEAADGTKKGIEAWQTLVHVCRLWRTVVFGSPRRLNLRLLCTHETPVRNKLYVWPALPLCIRGSWGNSGTVLDDMLAALGHSDRIRQVDIGYLQLEGLLPAMEVPFPDLTDLNISAIPCLTPVAPDSFLGGSTPRLQNLKLEWFPFPGLLKLLLSATNLVTLCLIRIPRSGYISPEAMATCLSELTRLRHLIITSFPYHEIPPSSPQKHVVLHALTIFEFRGFGEYLEDLVARVNAPRLNHMEITLEEYFGIRQLLQLVGRTPSLEAPDNARLIFSSSAVQVTLLSPTGKLFVNISDERRPLRISDRQVLALAQWEDIEITRWLELLRLFTAVKKLYLSEGCELHIAPALQELVEGRMTKVLPTLENLFLSGLLPWGPVHEGTEQFVAARQFTSPVVVSRWDGRCESDPYNPW